MTSKIREIIGKVSLVFISIVIGVLIVELTVKIFNIGVNININWEYHPILGWSQTPNGQYDYEPIAGTKVHVEFNSQGFRDVEHPVEKPPGVKRIVLIGDSFSESAQVNMADTFYRQLENFLNVSGQEKWEIINLGVGDFGTAQQWLALTEIGLKYSPDLVLHQIFPLNDICNNSIDLYGLCSSKNDLYRPYFVESGGKLQLTTKQPVRNFLRHHLVSYGVIERAVLSFRKTTEQQDEEIRKLRLKQLGFPPLEPIFYTFVNDHEQPDAVAKGWKITEMIIEDIFKITQSRNIPYMAIVVSFEARIGEAGWKSFSARQPPPKMIRDYPEKRLGRLFESLGIPSVMLKDFFEPHQDLIFPYWAGHFNPNAHLITAEGIYQKLVDEGIVADDTTRALKFVTKGDYSLCKGKYLVTNATQQSIKIGNKRVALFFNGEPVAMHRFQQDFAIITFIDEKGAIRESAVTSLKKLPYILYTNRVKTFLLITPNNKLPYGLNDITNSNNGISVLFGSFDSSISNLGTFADLQHLQIDGSNCRDLVKTAQQFRGEKHSPKWLAENCIIDNRYAASYARDSKLIILPKVVLSDGMMVEGTLTQATPRQFVVKAYERLGSLINMNEWDYCHISYSDSILNMPSIIIDGTTHSLEMKMVSENPFTFEISEADASLFR